MKKKVAEKEKEGEKEEGFTKGKFINNLQINKGHHRDFVNSIAEKKSLQMSCSSIH